MSQIDRMGPNNRINDAKATSLSLTNSQKNLTSKYIISNVNYTYLLPLKNPTGAINKNTAF